MFTSAYRTILSLLTAVLLFVTACSKDDNDSSPNNPSGQKIKTTVVGKLSDSQGNAIAGATVSLAGTTLTTDVLGLFVFKDIYVDSKRMVLKFSKAGLPDQLYACKPGKGQVTYVLPFMLSYEHTGSISSAAGGTVTTPDGASVSFPANAFVDASGNAVSGNITVQMNLVNHDDSDFSKIVPGRDLRAKDSDGNDRILLSYGMINVVLTGPSGQPVNLAQGKTASLTFPVTSSQQSSAPATIPLWYLDDATAIWKEEGTAVKNGNVYTATVSHFTWWNCDIPYPLASMNGRVYGCNGQPAANITVYCDWNAAYVTDNQGYYSGDAPASYGAIDVHACDGSPWTFGLCSQTETVPNLNAGQVYTVPDLIFTGTSNYNLEGRLVDCNGNNEMALLVISEPGTSNYHYNYVTNGVFIESLVTGSTYTFTAAAGSNYGQMTHTVNAVTNCQTDNIGDISVCTSTTSGTNLNFSIQLSGFGNLTYGYYVTNCVVSGTPTTQSQIMFTGVDSANSSSGLVKVKTSTYAPGNYTWNSTSNIIEITASLNGVPYTLISNSGSTTLTQTHTPGGNVTGSFSGSGVLTSTSFPQGIPVTFSGNFDVLRNQ